MQIVDNGHQVFETLLQRRSGMAHAAMCWVLIFDLIGPYWYGPCPVNFEYLPHLWNV